MVCRLLCAECISSPICDRSRGKCNAFGARGTQEPAYDHRILVSTVLAVAAPRQGRRPTRGASIRLSSTRGTYFIFLLPERTSVKEPTRNCHEDILEYSETSRAFPFATLSRGQSMLIEKGKDFHMLQGRGNLCGNPALGRLFPKPVSSASFTPSSLLTPHTTTSRCGNGHKERSTFTSTLD